jgi:hypothetical protein
MTQQLTTKSDVYSFGVVLLELIMAKPPIHENKYIVRQVKIALDMEDRMHCGLKDVMDPVHKMGGGGLLGFPRFLKLALQCVEEVAAGRPSMNGNHEGDWGDNAGQWAYAGLDVNELFVQHWLKNDEGRASVPVL